MERHNKVPMGEEEMSSLQVRTSELTKSRPNKDGWLRAPVQYWRAAAGARLMDQARPSWYLEVDKSRLDINNPSECAIAQVFGYYYDHGADVLGVSTLISVRGMVRSMRYGFCPGLLAILSNVSYRHLNRAWCYEIDKRLCAA